jgi:hypothetical protein
MSERGYIIPAFNTASVDYVACAQQLAHSIRAWHPEVEICLLTDHEVADSVFDHVCQIESQVGYANDWQVFRASPFRQTIKLEADMIAAGPVDHWWTLFEHRDVVISLGARDFYDRPMTTRIYRKFIDTNNLPDVYNAMTYWRRSQTAMQFFQLVRSIFENWDQYRRLVKFPEDTPSTDCVYAIAAQIVGPEHVTLPQGMGPQIVHMKPRCIPTQTSNWYHELVWENTDPGLRIQTVAQHGFVHYHCKEWRL